MYPSLFSFTSKLGANEAKSPPAAASSSRNGSQRNTSRITRNGSQTLPVDGATSCPGFLLIKVAMCSTSLAAEAKHEADRVKRDHAPGRARPRAAATARVRRRAAPPRGARALVRPRPAQARRPATRAATARAGSSACRIFGESAASTAPRSSADEIAERHLLLLRVPDEPADDLVRAAERHAAAHQLLGEIGRAQRRIVGGRAHPRGVELQPGDQPRHHAPAPGARSRSRRTAAPATPADPCCTRA